MNATHEDNSGDVHYFSLSMIKVATNYFSDEAKLGEGGFGPVFKVVMQFFLLLSNLGTDAYDVSSTEN